jgi:Mg2+-importing ATPase
MATEDIARWWLTPLSETQPKQGADTTGVSNGEGAGLSRGKAALRLKKFGPNLFRDHQVWPLWLQFLSPFSNPLVILLLVASAISALTGKLTNFFIIAAMVLFSVSWISSRSTVPAQRRPACVNRYRCGHW